MAPVRDRGRSEVVTWALPPVLLATSIGVARLSIELAPGERPGRESLFSTPALDLLLFGLALASCVVCFVWRRSALLTAAGAIGAQWYYSELYLSRSTDPLAGLVYVITAPLAAICGVCGLVAFFSGRSQRSRAQVTAE